MWQTIHQYLKQWARNLKNEIIAMYFVMKHPKTPLYVRILVAIVVGYALSPIDLIPDFVPIFGYIDDMILLPLGIALIIKIVSKNILQECREKAKNNPTVSKPKIWIAAYIIILLWFTVFYMLYEWLK